MVSILCRVVLLQMFGLLLAIFLLILWWTFRGSTFQVIIQNLKKWRYFEISSYKRTHNIKTVPSKNLFLQGKENLSFSLKERQNSGRRLSVVAMTISKMTSRSCEDFAVHWEMFNCFKGLWLFFHTTTSNTALTFPTILNWFKLSWIKRAEKFAQVCNGFIPWTDWLQRFV